MTHGGGPAGKGSDAVESYEREFARAAGFGEAVSFAFARTALANILLAAGLKPGDEIILSPLTCKVVPLTVISLDMKPVYADISPDTLNLDAEALLAACGSATQAVLFQHTYGSSGGCEAASEAARGKKLAFIEDRAQCLPGAEDSSSRRGVASIFSNNLTKPLPAGSGGMAVTDDPLLANRIRSLRDRLRRRSWPVEAALRVEVWLHRLLLYPVSYWPLFEAHRMLAPSQRRAGLRSEILREISGASFRISSYQARIGRQWLAGLDSYSSHRRSCRDHYERALTGIGDLEIPGRALGGPMYYFPILVDHKREVLAVARRRLIEVVAWPGRTPIYPVESAEELSKYGYRQGSCPIAEQVAGRLIGLPLHHRITPVQMRRTAAMLRRRDH